MTTATLTFRRPSQWKAVNMLFQRHIAGANRCTIARLRTDSGVDTHDVFEVEALGFIESTNHPDTPLNQHGVDPGIEFHQVTVRLTEAGQRWVTGDPGNTVLYGVKDRNGSCQLRQVVTDTTVDDLGVYKALLDAGWITIRTGGPDGDLIQTLTAACLTWGSAWVQLTAKGRSVTV